MLNSTFVSTTDWNTLLNNSATSLYDKLVKPYEDYYQAQSLISVTSTTSVQPLPSNFYKLISLDEVVSGGTTVDPTTGLIIVNGNTVPMKPFNIREQVAYQTPSGTRSAILTFIPTMTALVADTDTFDGINGWEEFIVLDAAIKVGKAEETDTSGLESDLEKIEKRIQDLSANRDAGDPVRMVDVRRVNPLWSNYSRSCLKYHMVGSNIRFVQSYFTGVNP